MCLFGIDQFKYCFMLHFNHQYTVKILKGSEEKVFLKVSRSNVLLHYFFVNISTKFALPTEKQQYKLTVSCWSVRNICMFQP
jgi:hypothetical protein